MKQHLEQIFKYHRVIALRTLGIAAISLVSKLHCE